MSHILGFHGGGARGVLNENAFCEEMKDIVKPYLEAIGEVSRQDGIYMELYGQADRTKGTVVISHGFCESADKYHELAYYLHRGGYQVAIPEHRGHGRSLREVGDKDLVHISDFWQYVDDLHRVMEQRIRERAAGGPLYLYAHSMGGCIGSLYLGKYPHVFQKALLSSPMLGVNTGGIPTWAVKAICDFMVLTGRGNTMVFNGHGFSGEPEFSFSGGESRSRYLHYLGIQRGNKLLQTNAASYRWLQQAIRAGRAALAPKQIQNIRIPVLLCSATRDSFVERKPQKRFAERLPYGKMVELDTRHEIYRGENDILQEHLNEVFGFFANSR